MVLSKEMLLADKLSLGLLRYVKTIWERFEPTTLLSPISCRLTRMLLSCTICCM